MSHCSYYSNAHVHRLQLEMSNYHITGTVTHNNGTTIVQASTREFCIARHLYKTTDVSASHNIGRVLAQRCLETGVNRVMWEDERTVKHNPKVRKYIIYMPYIGNFGVANFELFTNYLF